VIADRRICFQKTKRALLCPLLFSVFPPALLLSQSTEPTKSQSEPAPQGAAQDRTPRKTFTAIILYHVWDNERQAFQPGSQRQFISAVRSDGASVRGLVQSTPNGGIVFGRAITNPVARQVRYVGKPNGWVRTLGPKLAREDLAYSSVCTSDPKAEWSTLLGYGVVHIHRALVPEHGNILTDYWLAPALDCFPLKRTYDVGGSGRVAVHEAVFVVEGEPNPALFQIPAGEPEKDPAVPVVEKLEEAYHKATQTAPGNDQ